MNAHDAGRLNHAALTAAVVANFAAAARHRARAVALFAAIVPMELDRLSHALRRFLERKRHIAANIAAFARLIAAAAAEQVAKQIAERREDIFDVRKVVRAELPVEARMAEPVVTAALVAVVEHFERLGRLLEPLDRLLIARVLVRVILHRELAIGAGDLGARGRALDAKDFVIIALRGHL